MILLCPRCYEPTTGAGARFVYHVCIDRHPQADPPRGFERAPDARSDNRPALLDRVDVPPRWGD